MTGFPPAGSLREIQVEDDDELRRLEGGGEVDCDD
jgi:hypothetical protein